MLKRLLAGFTVAACAAAVLPAQVNAQAGFQPNPAYPTEEQYAKSKEAQEHVAKAMAIAIPDLVAQAQNACGPRGPQRPALERQAAGQAVVSRQRIEPVKLFDNLYFLGFSDLGAWAITTSEGIIMLDALNTPQEAEEILVPDLQKLGLNPADIKYVVVGHGHFDHFGGTPYLQERYGARIAMSAADWDLIARPSQNPRQANRARPKREIVVADGQRLTLGDTTITTLLTPGHTDGTLAILIPVSDKGRPHTAMLLSGANQTPNASSLAALERALGVAREQKAAILLNSHPGLFGDELGWMEAVRKDPSAPNPFVYGEARFARFIDIMIECARSRVTAMAY